MNYSKLILLLILTISTRAVSAHDLRADKELSVEQAYELRQQDPSAIFLDVREDWEWEEGRIEGAVHIPAWKLEELAKTLLSPTQHIIIYCRSGNRSHSAVQTLRKMGFQHVHSLRGGLIDWEGARLPVID